MPRGGGRKLAEAHWRFLYRAAVAEAQSLRPLIIDVGSSGCTHIYIYICDGTSTLHEAKQVDERYRA